jgi:outer membrane protein
MIWPATTRIIAEDTLASAYEALEAITGQPHPNVEVLREDFPVVNAEGSNESWTDQALNGNLALIAARYNLEAQQENLKARKSDHPAYHFADWRLQPQRHSRGPGR